ncbi:uncharacterized protein LOC113856527 [Abrus precatorius]|uniref:Uncharacterized protein LOC113856527 n=1 Tax=Abrus precatorius TaxID=3816 RepID=A0A8B8KK09_ABRPR|nr:uncharacterized protein LOC113856527 [Abrus precatorius]
MDAEQVLKLFDTYWFEATIFTNKTPSHFHSTLDSIPQSKVIEGLPLHTKLLRIPTLQVRSLSDQNLGSTVAAFSDFPSPNSVLTPQKLRPILSGKEVGEFPLEEAHQNHENEEEEVTKKKLSHSHRRRFRKGKTSRSLSDLEFKELKGFMDLGFVFSEEDKDSRLVSLIPGLQRLGREDAAVNSSEQKIDETVICRPYLSEAWGVLDQRKVLNPLLNWRVPVLGNEMDMKDNLKFWAQTVASIVR